MDITIKHVLDYVTIWQLHLKYATSVAAVVQCTCEKILPAIQTVIACLDQWFYSGTVLKHV